MKLAIVDVDGVVANADARFARAEEVKQQWIAEHRVGNALLKEYGAPGVNDIYWRAVFDPEQVPLDTLMDDSVNEALLTLQEGDRGYKVIFMTSRPESMRDATARWLLEQTVYDLDDMLVLKASAFQYTKTPVWKAGMVQTLVSLYNAEALLVIDDEIANILEITKYSQSLPAFTAAKSLSEAIAKLNGTWVEPDPFAPE